MKPIHWNLLYNFDPPAKKRVPQYNYPKIIYPKFDVYVQISQ